MSNSIPGAAEITPTPISLVTVTGIAAMPQYTPINEYAVMSIPAVWRGVNWLAGTLAGLPKSISKQAGRVYQPAAHPLNKLLTRKINPLTVPFCFWETFFHHCLLWGNGYGVVQRQPGSFRAIGIWNLNPEKVIPFRYKGDQWYFVKDGKGPGQPELLPAADVVHVPGLGFDGLQGYPLVSILAETFEWAKNALRFSARYFQKGTQVQGSIEIPAGVTKDQIAMIKDEARRYHSGIETDYDYLVLSGGASLKNNTVSPEQSQMIQTTEASNLAIARILGVPPFYVYELGRATWGNSEQQALDAVKYSLRPWIEKTEEVLADKLLTEAEQDAGLSIRFDVEDLVRGDAKSISETTIAEVNGGIRTANEGRSRLGLPLSTEPEADKLRVPIHNPVAPPNTGQPPAPAQHSAEPTTITLAALRPILDDVTSRVEAKTTKAFANKANKIGPDRTIWCNVFAEEQAQYVRAALAPVGQLVTLPIDTAADQYAAAIRTRGATGDGKTLAMILDDLMRGNHAQAA